MQCTCDFSQNERPIDTRKTSGQRRQDFPQKIENKSNKQKQCISNPQNDNLMKLKIRKRYR